MIDIEQSYKDKFHDSTSKRDDVKEGNYNEYHRKCSLFWLSDITSEDIQKMKHYMMFKKWIEMLRKSINEVLPPGFEVSSIEEQYLHYDKGGRFNAHKDTLCNALVDCHQNGGYPRLFSYLIYLNPDWTLMDGGEFTIYEGWPGKRVQE